MELEADKQSLCSLTVAAHPNGEAFHQAAILATVPANIIYHSFSSRIQGLQYLDVRTQGPKTPQPNAICAKYYRSRSICVDVIGPLLRQHQLLMGQFDVQGIEKTLNQIGQLIRDVKVSKTPCCTERLQLLEPSLKQFCVKAAPLKELVLKGRAQDDFGPKFGRSPISSPCDRAPSSVLTWFPKSYPNLGFHSSWTAASM